jgi:DNA-binding SARP family transcriptional activator/streptogramin lyase
MAAQLQFRILGVLEASRNGRLVALGSLKQRALLALLLLNPNEVVSIERLVEDLWPSDRPTTARNNVEVYVSRLRNALGRDVLLTHTPGYMLHVERQGLDASRFEQLVAAARDAADAESASDLLAEALALWRGPPLVDFAYEPFAQPEIARLEELRVRALEERIDADLALGRDAELVPEIERLIADSPYRERAWEQLMLALYRAGRQADALTAFQDARRRLVSELGIEPGPALQRLERQILSQDPALEGKDLHHRVAVADGPQVRATERDYRERPADASGPDRLGGIAMEERGQPAAPPDDADIPGRAPPHRLGRRKLLSGAAALLLAGIAALIAVLALTDGPKGFSHVDPNHVGVIDPKTNRIVDEIQVGLRPGPIAVGYGAVWVGNLDDRTVSRIDLKTKAVRTITLNDRTPTGIAVGAGAVWVAHGLLGTVSRIDPAYKVVTKLIRVTRRPPGAVGPSSGAVTVGPGSVWVSFFPSTVAKINPQTERVVTQTRVASPIDLAYGLGADDLWVATETVAAEGLLRFSPFALERPVQIVGIPSLPAAVSALRDYAWVTSPDANVVSRVQTRRAGVLPVAVPGGPSGVAAGAGAVWVTDRDGTVSRLDPKGARVDATIRVGNAPARVAVGGGSVWVTVQRR